MLAELLRKSIHLSGLILPVIYFFLDKPPMLIVVGILTGHRDHRRIGKMVFSEFWGLLFPNLCAYAS